MAQPVTSAYSKTQEMSWLLTRVSRDADSLLAERRESHLRKKA